MLIGWWQLVSDSEEDTLQDILVFDKREQKESVSAPEEEVAVPKGAVLRAERQMGAETRAKMEDLDRYFGQVEDNWKKSAEELFLEELKLGREKYKNYLQLKEELADELTALFEKYHQDKLKEHGAGHFFRFADELREEEEELKSKYLKKLRVSLGKKNFARYLDALAQFNGQIRRERGKREAFVEIEF